MTSGMTTGHLWNPQERELVTPITSTCFRSTSSGPLQHWKPGQNPDLQKSRHLSLRDPLRVIARSGATKQSHGSQWVRLLRVELCSEQAPQNHVWEQVWDCLVSARNDDRSFCHCEERSDEAIS